ncbi:16S rRNA (guanine(966)-N(2))-methyltransferase RsmD [Haploplasma axanthum]|uniref:N6-adenine-specific methylase n=1 Tax=Haploplasma axanthum TaxID=29552 RepID=A0A449BEH8_HAPAX|nr:16S rRNA (guanine(966)-N(2))-methyltransferase RsmD [Haploplasma axanthum]VEU80864.1 N6-adenine-specific methylase [Haploplasma axanthum]
MIRIHAGKFKGNSIKRVGIDSTRETASMVREAVFNSLYQINGNVLDLFGGSGSYGFTALSLGASELTLVDVNKRACAVLNDNALKLNILNNVKIYNKDYETFLKINTEKFDLVFLDPPYNFNSYDKLLEKISNQTTKNAKIILETDKKTNIPEAFNDFIIIKNKTYGIKKIVIYSNNSD